MKRSDKLTSHLMIKSQHHQRRMWDCCDFAIIVFLRTGNNKNSKKRIDNIKPFLKIIYFFDDVLGLSITFYKDDDKICPDSTELLEGRIWSL